MVKLIPMDPAEFDGYLEESTTGYAEDQVKNGNWDQETALEKSRAEYRNLLPDGVLTKDHHLLSIVDETSGKIGVLWFGVRQDGKRRRGYIYDFLIDEAQRGRGFGKQALAALDDILEEMQVDFIELHVFAHNLNARGLYTKMGYEETNLYMRKTFRRK